MLVYTISEDDLEFHLTLRKQKQDNDFYVGTPRYAFIGTWLNKGFWLNYKVLWEDWRTQPIIDLRIFIHASVFFDIANHYIKGQLTLLSCKHYPLKSPKSLLSSAASSPFTMSIIKMFSRTKPTHKSFTFQYLISLNRFQNY